MGKIEKMRSEQSHPKRKNEAIGGSIARMNRRWAEDKGAQRAAKEDEAHRTTREEEVLANGQSESSR